MDPGDLVQIRKYVQGEGDVGIVIGTVDEPDYDKCDLGMKLLNVMFHDGIRRVHPNNLQKPDGRTRRKS